MRALRIDSHGGAEVMHLVDVPVPVRAARTTLLDIRGELQRQTGRDDDVLRQQEQGNLAGALDVAEADDVLREVNVAARTIGLGDVQAFIQYSRQFTQPLSQLGSMANLLQSGVASSERVFELLDEQEQPGEEPDRRWVTADPVGGGREHQPGRVLGVAGEQQRGQLRLVAELRDEDRREDDEKFAHVGPGR